MPRKQVERPPPQAPTRVQPERDLKRKEPMTAEMLGELPKGARLAKNWSYLKAGFDTARTNRKRASVVRELGEVRRRLTQMASNMRTTPHVLEAVPPCTFSFGPAGGAGAGFYRTYDCRVFRYGQGVYAWIAVQEATEPEAPKEGKGRDGEVYITLVKLLNGYVIATESSRLCNKLLVQYCANGPMIRAYGFLDGTTVTIPEGLLNSHTWFLLNGWSGFSNGHAVDTHAIVSRAPALDRANQEKPCDVEPTDADGAFLGGGIDLNEFLKALSVELWIDEPTFDSAPTVDDVHVATPPVGVVPYSMLTPHDDSPVFWRVALVPVQGHVLILHAPDGVNALKPGTRVRAWRHPRDVPQASLILSTPRERRSHCIMRKEVIRDEDKRVTVPTDLSNAVMSVVVKAPAWPLFKFECDAMIEELKLEKGELREVRIVSLDMIRNAILEDYFDPNTLEETPLQMAIHSDIISKIKPGDVSVGWSVFAPLPMLSTYVGFNQMEEDGTLLIDNYQHEDEDARISILQRTLGKRGFLLGPIGVAEREVVMVRSAPRPTRTPPAPHPTATLARFPPHPCLTLASHPIPRTDRHGGQGQEVLPGDL